MNYLFFLVLGLIAALGLITGCARVKDYKPAQGSAPMSMNIIEEQQQKELNAFEAEGIALIKKGKLDEAYEIYKKIAGLSYYRGRGVQTGALSIMLGDIHDYGDFKTCVGWCTRRLEENPGENNIHVAQDLAVIYNKLNMFKESRGILKPYYSHKDADVDYYHDYSKYCIDLAEEKNIEKDEQTALMAEAKGSVDLMKEKFGESQKYYVALADYHTISRNFKEAAEALAKSREFARKEGDIIESSVLSTYSNFVQVSLMVLNNWDTKEALAQCKNGIKEYENLDQYNYERFYADRPLMMLFSEYYLNDSPIESWQVKKIMEEHEKMEARGMVQPKHLKILYQEIYTFLSSREKGDLENSLKSLRRLKAYAVVTQECPAYRPVYKPCFLGLLNGYSGQLYSQKGDYPNAKKAFNESLKYVSNNRVAVKGLKMVASSEKI